MQNWDKIQQDHNPHTIPHSRLNAFLDAADPAVAPATDLTILANPMSQEMMLKIQSGDWNIGVFTIFNQHMGPTYQQEQEKKRRGHEQSLSSLSQVTTNLAAAQEIWKSISEAFTSIASNLTRAAPIAAVSAPSLLVVPFVYEEINIGSETARLLDQRLERIVQMSEKLETIADPIERQQHEQALQRLMERTEERYGLRYAPDGSPLAVDISRISHLEDRLNPEGLDVSGTICAYIPEPEEPVCDVRPAPASAPVPTPVYPQNAL